MLASLEVVAAALPLAGLVAFLALRARRRRLAARAEDRDYELRFPEGPGDQPADRRTKVGRLMSRR